MMRESPNLDSLEVHLLLAFTLLQLFRMLPACALALMMMMMSVVLRLFRISVVTMMLLLLSFLNLD
jgi:hypothetical protein